MKFKPRNIRALGHMVVGDDAFFHYRSSQYITQFFEECDLDFVHDSSTRWAWAADRLAELLEEPQPATFQLPTRFVTVLRTLMDVREAEDDDRDRVKALAALNEPLMRDGLVALTFRSLNSFMRPFVRMPMGFCHLATSACGVCYKNH